jgi:AcrR family transcriptional regulator
MVTKDVIYQAALKLVNKKDLDKITVTDIVKECNITRQTFYYHFSDMVDLMEYSMTREAEELKRKNRNADSLEEMLHNYFDAILSKKNLIARGVMSRYALQAMEILVDGLKTFMLEDGEKKGAFDTMRVKDMNFFVEYHSRAIAVTSLSWIRDKNIDLNARIEQTAKVIRGEIHI